MTPDLSNPRAAVRNGAGSNTSSTSVGLDLRCYRENES